MPEEDLLALLQAHGLQEVDVTFRGRNARSNHEATAVLGYRARFSDGNKLNDEESGEAAGRSRRTQRTGP